MKPQKDSAPPVTEWIWRLAKNHLERFPRTDWPGGGKTSNFWKGWADAFATHDITESQANAASVLLMADPPEHIDHHLGRLLKIILGKRERDERDRSMMPREPEPTNLEAVALFREFLAAKGPDRDRLWSEFIRRARAEETARALSPAKVACTDGQASSSTVPSSVHKDRSCVQRRFG